MTGALVTVGINTLAFYMISEILPGFEIKNKKVAVLVAIAYSFLMFVGALLVAPLAVIVSIGLVLVSFIPFIGPLIAGAGILVTTFLVTFVLTVLMLILIDRMMEDFSMRSSNVAYIAAFLLAVFNVIFRLLLPGF
jgi:uncharacterized membrane protein YvlD (DUF360 family)